MPGNFRAFFSEAFRDVSVAQVLRCEIRLQSQSSEGCCQPHLDCRLSRYCASEVSLSVFFLVPTLSISKYYVCCLLVLDPYDSLGLMIVYKQDVAAPAQANCDGMTKRCSHCTWADQLRNWSGSFQCKTLPTWSPSQNSQTICDSTW